MFHEPCSFIIICDNITKCTCSGHFSEEDRFNVLGLEVELEVDGSHANGRFGGGWFAYWPEWRGAVLYPAAAWLHTLEPLHRYHTATVLKPLPVVVTSSFPPIDHMAIIATLISLNKSWDFQLGEDLPDLLADPLAKKPGPHCSMRPSRSSHASCPRRYDRSPTIARPRRTDVTPPGCWPADWSRGACDECSILRQR